MTPASDPLKHAESGNRGVTLGGDGDKEPLQVRIPAAVKRHFKACAALRGIAPNELFVEVWAYYQSNMVSPQVKDSK